MKSLLFGFAALTIALIPTAPVAANGAHDPHVHGWYVHYRHHQGGRHVAGPFHPRHDADHHARHLRDRGYHIERIVRN